MKPPRVQKRMPADVMTSHVWSLYERLTGQFCGRTTKEASVREVLTQWAWLRKLVLDDALAVLARIWRLGLVQRLGPDQHCVLTGLSEDQINWLDRVLVPSATSLRRAIARMLGDGAHPAHVVVTVQAEGHSPHVFKLRLGREGDTEPGEDEE